MSQESSDEEESLNVLSVQSESKSNADDEGEEPSQVEEEKPSKKKKSKKSKTGSKLSKEGTKKLKTKLLKGLDKVNLLNKFDQSKVAKPVEPKKKVVPKEQVQESQLKKAKQKAKEPLIKAVKKEAKVEPKAVVTADKPIPIDKSKLRYSQTNLAKSIQRPQLYDRNAEESISNILNRKSPNKTTSFTTRSYIDKSAAIIEADQTIKFKDQKPVVSQRISPEKMTKSLNVIVRHLFKNKKSLDRQPTNQESKSTIKISLSSFINEDGERFD